MMLLVACCLLLVHHSVLLFDDRFFHTNTLLFSGKQSCLDTIRWAGASEAKETTDTGAGAGEAGTQESEFYDDSYFDSDGEPDEDASSSGAGTAKKTKRSKRPVRSTRSLCASVP